MHPLPGISALASTASLAVVKPPLVVRWRLPLGPGWQFDLELPTVPVALVHRIRRCSAGTHRGALVPGRRTLGSRFRLHLGLALPFAAGSSC